MINFNGDLLAENSDYLNHTNRGLRYGDALFETLKYNGKSILFWEDHYFRLMASMRQLRMEIPVSFTMEYLEAEIKKTLKSSQMETAPARVRVTVFRNSGGYYLPQTLEVSFIIEVTRLSEAEYQVDESQCIFELYKDYLIPADGLSRLKHSNKLIHVLGSIYASENGYDSCFLLNQKKEVIESLKGNIFLRFGDKIKTPPLESGCLDGIMRKQLLKIGQRDTRHQWEEAVISPFELQQADEIFTTNVIQGLRPVTNYRKANYQIEAARQLTETLNNRIRVMA
ncbi:aminotransferase class IV [Robiginitalea sp. IMCC44478]|uniref:aminotransferase class IV n=1 Tax=Robiginitalea sp. IMCC44478 TaxID=3459122 RepID=UPI00404127F0